MNVTEAIRKRSSTRGYTSEPLTDNELDALIHAGLQAPTAVNRREIHFTVLKGDNPILKEIEYEKNRLRDLSNLEHNFYYEAPIVIILSADANNKWASVDAGIAVENIAVTAEELGLGSVIIGCIYDALLGEKREYFENALKFSAGNEYKIAIAVGHKAVCKEPHTYDVNEQVTYL